MSKIQNSSNNKKSKSSKMKLVILDEHHKELFSIKGNRNKFLTIIISIFILFGMAIYCLIAFTPIKNIIPGYPDSNSRMIAIQNSLTIDSLKNEIKIWELQVSNIQRIAQGETPLSIDSLITQRSGAMSLQEKGTISAKDDSLLREEIRKQEQFSISINSKKIEQIEGLHFFKPIQGVITEPFNLSINHPYIDVAAPKGSIIYSILDGTVISADWNDQTGYTIQIQHDNNLISIYKHAERVLKSTGDKIEAGTPIAIVGNTGKLSTGEHLHFELWHGGEAIDPTQYINF